MTATELYNGQISGALIAASLASETSGANLLVVPSANGQEVSILRID